MDSDLQTETIKVLGIVEGFLDITFDNENHAEHWLLPKVRNLRTKWLKSEKVS